MKTSNYLKAAMIALTLIVNSAHAEEPETVVPMTRQVAPCQLPVKVRRGEFETVQLGRWFRLDSVMIQFRGPLFGSADIEVLVNGQSKKVINVHWSTSALVDLDERANAITFRHLGNGAGVKITKIEIIPYGIDMPEPNLCRNQRRKCPGQPGPESTATEVLYDMQEVLFSLVELVSADDNAKYASPIRAQVGRVLSIATVHGDLSQETKDAIATLLAMTAQARPWLDQLAATQLTYDLAVEFESDEQILINLLK